MAEPFIKAQWRAAKGASTLDNSNQRTMTRHPEVPARSAGLEG
jgi:hypothetical protein